LSLSFLFMSFSSLQAASDPSAITVHKNITQLVPSLDKFSFLRDVIAYKIIKYKDKTTYM